MRKPGHERCHTCADCGLGWCPDCDDEGRICLCEGWGNDMVKTPVGRSVDIPLHRPKPKRRKANDRGSATVEYGLLTAVLAAMAIAIGGVGMGALGNLDDLDLGQLQTGTTHQAAGATP